MFEEKTVNNLHKELLDNIDNSYEKSVGELIYDVTKSFAIQENKIYKALQLLFNKLDVDKLTGDELTKYVKQRKGIIRNLATKAKGKLEVIGNGTINIGDLFETQSGIQFEAIEQVIVNGTAEVNITALVSGNSGNVGANSITLTPITIAGITSVNNPSATYDGYNEESDKSLRERYYLALRTPPTSGNKWHYLFWCKSVSGCGDAKIFPLWTGDNTVKCTIIDIDKKPANEELINRVQEYIDPLNEYGQPSGTGSGEAPIGAYCTIISATGKEITVKVKLTKLVDYTDEEVKTNISNKIVEYFKDIAYKQNYVSFGKIGGLILESEGVSDYTELYINDTTANISVTNEEVAILKEVILL